MLQSIRAKAQHWIFTVIIGVLVVSFAFFGIARFFQGSASSNYVAKVDGYKISQEELNLTYERLRRELQFRLGNKFVLTPQLAQTLKTQALEQIIHRTILTKSAFSQGYRVTHDQINSALLSIPLFQDEGEFSAERFQNVLSNLLYTEQAFLAQLESDLLVSQEQIGLTSSSFALPSEIICEYRLKKEERSFSYVIIPANKFASEVTITESMKHAFYDAHKEDFETHEQVSIAYLELNLQNLKKKNPQEAQQQFATDSDKLANITFSDSDSLDRASQELNLPIQKTPLFTRQGLKTGLASNPKIINAAFSHAVLVEHYNSDPIQISPNQIIVLRVNQHEEAAVKPYSLVAAQITKILSETGAMNKAKTMGDDLLAHLKTEQDLQQVAIKYGLAIKQVNAVNRESTAAPKLIISSAFELPRPSQGRFLSLRGLQLPEGDYVVIGVNKIISQVSSPMNSSEATLYRNQLAAHYGDQEYNLYVHQLIQEAKVTRTLR